MELRVCRNSKGLGFTLIELMVVFVLIGIMTAMIIPAMRGTYEDALLRSTSRKLVNVLNLASSRAIAINQLHRVRLDHKNGRYFVERRTEEGGEGLEYIPVRDVPGGEGEMDTRISIEFRAPGEGDRSAPEASFVSGDDSRKQNRDEVIAFYPDGTAEAGDIVLRDRDGFRLALRI